MKAPTADYSQLQNAISARGTARQALYSAKDAANLEERYKIQQDASNFSLAVNLTQAGLNFASTMYNNKLAADKSDSALKETNANRDIETLINNNSDKIDYVEQKVTKADGTEGTIMVAKPNEELQAMIDQITDSAYADTHYVGEVSKLVPDIKKSLQSNAASVAQQVYATKGLQDRNAKYAQLESEATRSSVASQNASEYTINGNSYMIGADQQKVLALESSYLTSDALEAKAVSMQSAYRTGVIQEHAAQVLVDRGFDEAKKTVMDSVGTGQGQITNTEAVSIVNYLEQANSTMEADPNQTKLNFAVAKYTETGDIDSATKALQTQYPTMTPVEIQETIAKAVSYGAADVEMKTSQAQDNIAKAIEANDSGALAKAIESVPGAKAQLQNYANQLQSLSDDNFAYQKERELENFKSNHTFQETYDELDKWHKEGVITDSQYTAIKTTLGSWESASEAKSVARQKNEQVVKANDSVKEATLRQAALDGGTEAETAYLEFLSGRDKDIYGEGAIISDTEEKRHQLYYDKADMSLDKTMSASGYSAAEKSIEDNPNLTSEQKKALKDTLGDRQTRIVEGIQSEASEFAAKIAKNYESGTVAAADIGKDLSSNWTIAQSNSQAYAEGYQGYYTDTVKTAMEGALGTALSYQISAAANAKDADGNGNTYNATVELHNALIDTTGDYPEFLQPTIDQYKESLNATITSMENTYGEKATQMFMNRITGIQDAVKNGTMTGSQAITAIQNLYGIASTGGSFDFGTDETPNVWSTKYADKDQIDKINSSALAAIKAIAPDMDSIPELKAQMALISDSVFGSEAKKIPEEDYPYYLQAQQEYYSSVFDYCVKWSNDTEHKGYTAQQFRDDLTAARQKFDKQWLKIQETDPDTDNGAKKARQAMKLITADGITLKEGVEENETGVYSVNDLVLNENYSKMQARIHDDLRTDKGYNIPESEGAYVMQNKDGSVSLLYRETDESGEKTIDWIEYNTQTQKIYQLASPTSNPSTNILDYLGKPNSGDRIRNAYEPGDTGILKIADIQWAYESGLTKAGDERNAAEGIINGASSLTDQARWNATYWDRYQVHMAKRRHN